MRLHRCFLLLMLLALLALAGCASTPTSGTTAQSATQPPAMPTATLTTSLVPTSVPTSTPLPAPRCPNFGAPPGPAPAAAASVYLETSTAVIALDPNTGSERWRQPLVLGGPFSSLTLDSNLLYAAIQNGEVVALNAANGALRWCATTPGAQPLVTAAQGVVYVGSANNNGVAAFNGSDGKQLWQTQVSSNLSSLTVAGGHLYVSTQGVSAASYFLVLNSSNGTVLWQQSDTNGIFSVPVVTNGVVYVTEQPYGNDTGAFNAFNPDTGTQRWRVQEPQGVQPSQPAVDNGLVYGTDTWGVYAFSISSGALRWSVQAPYSGNPLVLNGILFAFQVNLNTGQQGIKALSESSGAIDWSWHPSGAALAFGQRAAVLCRRRRDGLGLGGWAGLRPEPQRWLTALASHARPEPIGVFPDRGLSSGPLVG